MPDSATESKPLREKLLPQTSIRFYLILIGFSALIMVVFRSAAGGTSWARIASLLIATIIGCFIVYTALFLIANLFSSTTAPIVRAMDPRSGDQKES